MFWSSIKRGRLIHGRLFCHGLLSRVSAWCLQRAKNHRKTQVALNYRIELAWPSALHVHPKLLILSTSSSLTITPCENVALRWTNVELGLLLHVRVRQVHAGSWCRGDTGLASIKRHTVPTWERSIRPTALCQMDKHHQRCLCIFSLETLKD